MTNHKIIKIVLCTTIVLFSAGALASSLSQSTLDACKDYITNPTPESAKTNSEALSQCYQNDVCDDQLSDVADCTHNLQLWNLNFSPEPKTSKTAVAPAATTPAPTTPQIPAMFHSTSPNQPVATPETNAETTTVTTQPAQENNVAAPAPTQTQPAQTEPTQKNEKKPSINWF